jgi:hypothetical protein
LLNIYKFEQHQKADNVKKDEFHLKSNFLGIFFVYNIRTLNRQILQAIFYNAFRNISILILRKNLQIKKERK